MATARIGPTSSAEQKYVRVEGVGFILWPSTDALWHLNIAQGLPPRSGRILSAGFARLSSGTVKCYGRSESLGISGRPDDTASLAAQLGLRPAK